MVSSLDFLQSVSGFVRQSAAMPDRLKLGVIDANYPPASYPTEMPRVTFAGETTLSGRRYAVAGSYRPTPGDRVVLVPVGTTYVIIGALDADASTYASNATVASTLTVAGTLVVPSGAAISAGDWISYDPSWIGSTTNPTLANATKSSRYRYVDAHTVEVQIYIKAGSGSSKGDGTYYLTLPVTPAETEHGGAVGAFVVNDSGAALRNGAVMVGDTTSRIAMILSGWYLGSSTLTGTFSGSWIKADYRYRV